MVRPTNGKVGAAQQQVDKDLPGQDIKISFENDTAFIHGIAKDLTSADRAAAIAATLSTGGKVVNLLNVNVPPTEAQILLKVRFADVDRGASQDLGLNLFSTGATNTIGSVTTGAFNPPTVRPDAGGSTISLSDALNIFLFRRDLNLGATIKALEARRLLQILAEPNVLAINGKQASFLAGGEFPFPTLQGGGGGLGAVTIQFREFGVRINFTPVITPRGTIRLQVTPEVSSLDFANGLLFQGFNIPALSTRRVQTEIELESGQSFVIGGLLDNRVTESLSKIPGLANIPLLGKLFQSRSLNRNNTELLILVTPELVRPIPQGQPLPDVQMPKTFLDAGAKTAPRTPGMDITGPVPVKAQQETIPVEQLIQSQKSMPGAASQAPPQIQFVPVLMPPGQSAPAAPTAPPPAAPPRAGGGGGLGASH
jgi:pilus assembly protein CpaC